MIDYIVDWFVDGFLVYVEVWKCFWGVDVIRIGTDEKIKFGLVLERCYVCMKFKEYGVDVEGCENNMYV